MLLNIIGNLEHGTFGQLPETQEICNIWKVDAAIVLTQCWFFLISCWLNLLSHGIIFDTGRRHHLSLCLLQESFHPIEVIDGLWIVPKWRDPPVCSHNPYFISFFSLNKHTNNILDWFLSLYIAQREALLVLKSSLYVFLFGA